MNYPKPYAVNFDQRDPAPGVDPLFVERWSPRALRKADIPEADLRTIFDAARWSPSCYNEQPLGFVTSTPASFAAFSTAAPPARTIRSARETFLPNSLRMVSSLSSTF